MLKGVPPLLNGELLKVLRDMGHGDELILVDGNFPAEQVARHTVSGECVRLDGADMPAAAAAILQVMPLDSYVEAPILRMEVDGAPERVEDVHRELHDLARRHGDRAWSMASVERMAFYERARDRGYAVVATGERRGYGCFILIKGVIGPDGAVV